MNNDWIKNLKVGDKVVTASAYNRAITTVERILDSGRIRTANGILFNPDGTERTSQMWGSSRLVELTDGVLLEFKKSKLIKQCEEIKFKELSIEQLKKILSVLES